MRKITLAKLLTKPHTARYNLRGELGEVSTEYFLNLFRSILKKPSLKNLVLFINSTGGDAGSGQIAYDILRKISKYVKVITVNVGAADSAAFTIFSAGDERLAMKYSTFTIHYSSLNGGSINVQNINQHHKYLVSDKRWDDSLYKSLGYEFTRADKLLLDNGGDLVLTVEKAEKRNILTGQLK